MISSREKTSINEEFAVLEKDIELRKEGINKCVYHPVSRVPYTTVHLYEISDLRPLVG